MAAIKTLLIANRGEIAVRIIRAARELGIRTVQAYSAADANSLAVKLADVAVNIGPPQASKSYLAIDAILAAAYESQADAVHPGYGFLAENADFADAVEAAGLIFVGPPGSVIRLMGDKAAAREIAAKAGVPTVPGSGGRRRRARHPHRQRSRRARSAGAAGERRSQSRLWRRRALSRKGDRARAPYRGAGARRRTRRRPPFRTRVFSPASPSEALGGSAGRRSSGPNPRPSLRLRRAIGAGGFLSRRRHARIPLRRDDARFLFHRNEHAHPGGASGDRVHHRRRSRARDDQDRGRRAACPASSRYPLRRPFDRMPHQRRRSRQGFHAVPRHRQRSARPGRPRRALRQHAVRGLRGAALLRFTDRQIDRLGRKPRRRDCAAGTRPRGIRDRGPADHDRAASSFGARRRCPRPSLRHQLPRALARDQCIASYLNGSYAPMAMRYSFGGDEHVFVEVDEEMSLEAFFKSLSITNAVRESRIKGVTEICPANASFQIKFDPDLIAPDDMLRELQRLESAADTTDVSLKTRIIEIPVLYNDPWTRETLMRFRERHQDPAATDIEYAARINNFASVEDFIAAHSGSPWFVSMVGFVAGLPFLYQMVERSRQIEAPK